MGESAYYPSGVARTHGVIYSRTSIYAWAVSLFWLSLLVQIIGSDAGINLYDEGIILTGAERVHRGDIPYRDFWTIYGPAQFYLTAWLSEWFGPSVIALRLVGMLSKAVAVVLIFDVASRRSSRAMALAAAMICLGMLVAVKNDAFPIFPALALAMGAYLLFELGLARHWGYFVAAGLLTGLAATFRHDLGAYNAMAVGLLAVLSSISERRWASGRFKTWRARFLVSAGAYGLGVMLVLAPVSAILLHVVPLAVLYEDLVRVPAQVYPLVRALPFPSVASLWEQRGLHPSLLKAFIVYVPFMVVVWTALVEVERMQRERVAVSYPQSFGRSAVILSWAAMTVLFAMKGVVRVSPLHMVQALVLSTMLLVAGAMRINWRARRMRWVHAMAWLCSGALLMPLAISGWKQVWAGAVELRSGRDNLVTRCQSPESPLLRCLSLDENTLQAVQYVQSHTRAYEPIYVGTTRHDKIFINSVVFYFVAERASVTKWHELHPGIQTTEPVQQAMVAEFETNPPKLLVLDERWDDVQEPNASSRSSGVVLLDHYIAQHFQELARFGSVHILARL